MRVVAGTAQVLTLFVVVVDIILVAAGVITVRAAVTLWAVIEVPLVVATTALFVRRVRAVVQNRGWTNLAAFSAVLAESPLWAFAKTEFRAYRSLWMLLRGRKDGSGDAVFTSSAGALTMPTAFAVATAIEIAVLHLIIPWPWLSIVMAIMSVWALALVFGLVATDIVHPHYLRGSTIVLRHSGRIVAEVPIDADLVVRLRRSASPTSPTVDGPRLHLPNQDGTNVELALSEQVSANIGSMIRAWRRVGEVSSIQVHVDEPEALVGAVRGIQYTSAQVDT